jgi:AraC family ethanolamine operon transcriptional activator
LRSLRADDSSQLSAARGCELEYVQLERGRALGSVSSASLLRISLHRARFERRVQVLGSIHAAVVPMALVVSAPGAGWFQFRPFAPGDLLYMGNSTRCDFIAPGDTEVIGILVPEDLMRREAAACGGGSASDRRPGDPVVRLAPTDRARLERTLALVFRATDRGEIVEEELQSSTVSLLWRAVHGATTQGREQRDGPSPPRIQHTRRATGIIEQRLQRGFRLESLAEEVGVSPRTLQIGFREVFQMSPMVYLRVRRLNALRQLLRHSSPGDLSVAEAARRFGFAHLGRLSRNYELLFEELPSHTRVADPARIRGEPPPPAVDRKTDSLGR